MRARIIEAFGVLVTIIVFASLIAVLWIVSLLVVPARSFQDRAPTLASIHPFQVVSNA